MDGNRCTFSCSNNFPLTSNCFGLPYQSRCRDGNTEFYGRLTTQQFNSKPLNECAAIRFTTGKRWQSTKHRTANGAPHVPA